MSRAYRVNLNVLALVALFTGGLLVFSTQALAVVRRRAQFALLRTLGMSRRRLVKWLLVEAALVGTVGALAGIAGGYVLAHGVLRWFGADLGAGYFRGAAPAVVFDPVAAAAFGLLGIAAALLGSALPAREAARAVPAAALKAGGEPEANARVRGPAPGLMLLALGGALTLLPPVSGLPLPGYAAIALMLLGTLLLLPRVFAYVLGRLPAPRSAPVLLARAQLQRQSDAGGRESRDDRRQRVADGVDGDHGRLVPAVARRLARRGPARRCLPACRRRRRQQLLRRRSAADTGGFARHRAHRFPARAERAARPRRTARDGARARPAARGADPRAAAHRRQPRAAARRAARRLGQRGGGRPARNQAGRHVALAAGRAARTTSSSPASGATMRASTAPS